VKKALVLSLLIGLAITQGEVDFNLGGNGSGRYEKTTSFVVTGEKKPISPKTPADATPILSPIGIQPKRVIRIPVKPEDIMPEAKK